MLEVYAAWTEGAGDADVAAIKQAMESGASVSTRLLSNGGPLSTPESPEFASYLPVEDQVLDPGSRVTEGFTSKKYLAEREGLLGEAPRPSGPPFGCGKDQRRRLFATTARDITPPERTLRALSLSVVSKT